MIRGAMAVLACAVAALAQAPSFDVASVKPSPPPEGDLYHANLGTAFHGEVLLSNATLSDCVKFAYGLSNDMQLEGPGWITDKSIRFDIQAKAAPDTPRPQLLVMLQNLLTERFRLGLHHEEKTRSYMALTTGKKALKIQQVPADAPTPSSNNGPGHIISSRISMQAVALLLSRFLRQPVINMTGLDGFYDVHLEWAPETDNPADLPSGPSVFTAVQDQLGLKLESRKGPLEILVIDQADKTPIAN